MLKDAVMMFETFAINFLRQVHTQYFYSDFNWASADGWWDWSFRISRDARKLTWTFELLRRCSCDVFGNVLLYLDSWTYNRAIWNQWNFYDDVCQYHWLDDQFFVLATCGIVCIPNLRIKYLIREMPVN